jgi:hypothetical protein
LHTYANKCLFCDEEGVQRKVKDYKEVNTDLPFNLYFCCDLHFKANHKKRPAFKRFALKNGWVYRWGRGWARQDSQDWTLKEK